jgi:hypothetical protein
MVAAPATITTPITRAIPLFFDILYLTGLLLINTT